MRRTRQQCHGDRDDALQGHATKSRHRVADESIGFEFSDRSMVVCGSGCCRRCCGGGGIFLYRRGPARRREREEFVMVWILREEGSVFLGGVSVACPCV